MNIHLSPQSISKIQSRLKAQAQKLQDMTPYWQIVGMYVQKQTINERFNKEQSPDGTKWLPLSPARIKQRMKKHKHGQMKILQDVGELRKSIVYEAGKNYVRIGSNLKYAATHQFGRGNIPARPYLGITPYEKNHILSICKTYIKNHIFGGG